MKIYLGLGLAVLLMGCAATPRDPLAKFYWPYLGEQTPWPVSDVSFATERDGMKFYYGEPPFPYTVIGRYDRFIPERKLVRSAKFNNADAVMEIDLRTFVTSINGGVIAGHSVTPLPLITSNSHDNRAYLIKFGNPLGAVTNAPSLPRGQ